MMNENDKVTIAPEILQDQSYQTNHHFLVRIVNNKEVGFIREKDLEKSEVTKLNYYWVQFHVAAILIEEKYLIKQEV